MNTFIQLKARDITVDDIIKLNGDELIENGRVSASVAQYVFDVTANDSYNTNDNFATLKLAQTCNSTTLTDGKIEPGTSGSFERTQVQPR